MNSNINNFKDIGGFLVADQLIDQDEEQSNIEVSRLRRGPRFNVVGISAGYHDSACSLLQDGELIAAAQEERFTRVKNDKSFPRQAFQYCLDAGGIKISEVDCVAYYEDPVAKLSRQIWTGLITDREEQRRSVTNALGRRQPKETIRALLGYDGQVEIVDHHLSHAASSYYFSGFQESAILTIDGVGEWPTTTYGYGKGSSITRFEQVDFPDSLGFLYSAITAYLGFEVNEGEYKVMGLAPYGRPIYFELIRELIDVGPDGQFRLQLKYFEFLSGGSMFSQALTDLLKEPPREPESELRQFHMDVARSVQAVLEEVLLEKTRYLYERFPSENLCLAGGVALNVVANSRCLRDGPFKRLFVQPAAGDAGGAVGAAAVAHIRLKNEWIPRPPLSHVYLGPTTPSSEIRQLLQATSAKYQNYVGREQELIQQTVERLKEGQVIGWFQGRMEFGPRALGARSILADPRHPDMRDRINAIVKMREAFRPFAPAVLMSKLSEHFQLDHPSPFMLETCQVTSPFRLPAVTHIDGSARVQTVEASTNSRFALLLQEFERQTGCPILLNTSFNMRGEPIVCTAVDAIMCFIRSRLDLLVLEDFVLERSDIPPLWELEAQAAAERPKTGEEIGHKVYTFL